MKKIKETISILGDLGWPQKQQNERLINIFGIGKFQKNLGSTTYTTALNT